MNFVSLRGWSPKDDREVMSRQEMIDAFSLEGINHSNAMVNFTEDDPFDPKAVWLNAEHIKQRPWRSWRRGCCRSYSRGIAAEICTRCSASLR